MIDVLGAVIYRAIDEIEPELADGVTIPKHPDTPLLGRDATLDSVIVVTLAITVETLLAERFGRPITLFGEEMPELDENPFETLGTLARYVDDLLDSSGVADGATDAPGAAASPR